MHPFLAGLRESPDFLLQNLDFSRRHGLVVRVDEPAYRRAPFLDERLFTAHTQGVWFPLETLLASAGGLPPQRPPHYIFHVGHCGSTLISRLLGELPHMFSLREPLTLLALAMAQRELGAPGAPFDADTWQRLLHMSLQLLSRTYRRDDRAVIKLTSAAANLAGMLLQHHSQSRALLLYLDLETWLATMLRAEAARENVRAYAGAWLADFNRLTGRDDLRLPALSDAQQAVINWLAGLLTMTHAAGRFPDRTYWVNFDAFLSAPEDELHAIAGFLGSHAPAETLRNLTRGPLMGAYAKNLAEQYDAAARQRELEASRRRCADEITTALRWAEKLCRSIQALEPVAHRLSPHRGPGTAMPRDSRKGTI